MSSPNILGGTGNYAHFLVLNKSITATGRAADEAKTCQRVPRERNKVYIYNLRWADNWTSPNIDLDFFISSQTSHLVTYAGDALVNTATQEQQLPRQYPVRRAAKFNEVPYDTRASASR